MLFLFLSEISLPSSYKNERDEAVTTANSSDNMHIGGFNFLQQNKAENAAAAATTASAVDTSATTGILKESNKNTSSDFKSSKKYKFGHVNKSFEPSSAYGKRQKCMHTCADVAVIDNQLLCKLITALFECIEDNQYDQLKGLLEQKQLNANALNNDGFSVLDLAVLVNNRSIIKLLLQHGAQTGSFPRENIESHLNTLLADAEKKLSQCVTNAGTSTTSQAFIDVERQKLAIEKRIKLIRKMTNGWQRLKVPDPPFSFTIGNERLK
jgi:hypothetical protein